MKYLILAFFLSTGCGLTVDPAPPPPAPACAPAACGWVDNAETGTESCTGPFTFAEQQQLTTENDGANTCWVYDTVCVAQGTPAECVPDKCRREHVTCQPTQPMGGP